MRLSLIVLFACALAARADDKDELKKLEGSWEMVSVTAGGKDFPKDKAPNLTIKDGKMTGFGPEMKLTTDATKKPKWLEMTFARDGKEQTVHCIYELEGDELKFAMPLAPVKGSGQTFENKRPENFDSTDKPVMVIKVKKAK